MFKVALSLLLVGITHGVASDVPDCQYEIIVPKMSQNKSLGSIFSCVPDNAKICAEQFLDKNSSARMLDSGTVPSSCANSNVKLEGGVTVDSIERQLDSHFCGDASKTGSRHEVAFELRAVTLAGKGSLFPGCKRLTSKQKQLTSKRLDQECFIDGKSSYSVNSAQWSFVCPLRRFDGADPRANVSKKKKHR